MYLREYFIKWIYMSSLRVENIKKKKKKQVTFSNELLWLQEHEQ